MKTIFLCAAATAALLAAPVLAADKPEIAPWGFDAAGMDRSIAPGDDFLGYGGGTYLRQLEIPVDRSNYGMFTKLRDLSQERTREIIEAAAARHAGKGSAGQKVGDYYASFLDEAVIEAKGLAPIKADLDAVAALRSKPAFAAALGTALRSYGPSPFLYYVNQDEKAPDHYIPVFYQGGIGLPDRDYYLVDNPAYVDAREAYKAHIARMFALAGVSAVDAAKKAAAIYDLEHKFAEVHWTVVDSRDSDKAYNKWTKADFAAKAPGLDWNIFFAAAGLANQNEFIVSQPSSFTGMAKIIGDADLATLRDWLAFKTLKDAAPLLPKAFVDENFAFEGTTLSGTPEIQPRWKRGVDSVNGALGEAVGELYVARYFTPEAKAKADELVRNLIAAMDARIANLAWMTPETKVKARAKLASFKPKIGYPVKWIDYSALEIVPGDAFGNARRAAVFEYDRNLAKLGKLIDRDEWFMTPQTVNAYANPTMNEVVFPAAILQPPFFDPNADAAVNYGAIGAVIGHEITHHFDDQGRKYDPTGKLADWWTPEDVTRFKVYTDQVVAQYGAYEPLPGAHINGELTLGENIADIAGLTVAYDAYTKSLGGKPAPVLDGFTGDQRFFLGYSQIWRQKYRDVQLQQQLATDPHTPGNWRPTAVRNLDGWYRAFNVKPGQKLYLPEDQRIRIW
ncbi:MAG: M13 family peptidase [Sphingomonadaceae bacterium]|nr:M13 family peptidase [Sphingomonadaceae bacterium]